MYNVFFIHSLDEEYLGCFQFLDIMNKAVMGSFLGFVYYLVGGLVDWLVCLFFSTLVQDLLYIIGLEFFFFYVYNSKIFGFSYCLTFYECSFCVLLTISHILSIYSLVLLLFQVLIFCLLLDLVY